MRAFWLLILLAACGNGGDTRSEECSCPPPEFEGTPDVVLLTVSGRNLDLEDFFCPPECNEPYLGEAGDAGEAIFTASGSSRRMSPSDSMLKGVTMNCIPSS